MRALITVIPIIALILSIAACQGAAGPAGEQGPPGPQGSSGAPGLVDEATVASLIEQIQEQLDTGYATATVPPKSQNASVVSAGYAFMNMRRPPTTPSS